MADSLEGRERRRSVICDFRASIVSWCWSHFSWRRRESLKDCFSFRSFFSAFRVRLVVF